MEVFLSGKKRTKRPAGIRISVNSLTGGMTFQLNSKSQYVLNEVQIRLKYEWDVFTKFRAKLPAG